MWESKVTFRLVCAQAGTAVDARSAESMRMKAGGARKTRRYRAGFGIVAPSHPRGARPSGCLRNPDRGGLYLRKLRPRLQWNASLRNGLSLHRLRLDLARRRA